MLDAIPHTLGPNVLVPEVPRANGTESPADLIGRFISRVEDYRATAHRSWAIVGPLTVSYAHLGWSYLK